ncbi:MAG: VanZ family protein [Desulfosoma sp.]|uniref:VanZ family protein n=1 Tax=Desulfosoma sp. TaxID=2603217 RepID=UPI004049768F
MAAVFALHLAAGMLIKGFLDPHHLERLVPLSALALGLGFCLWAHTHNQKAHQTYWMRLVPDVLYAFFIAAMSHQPLTGVRLPVSANLFHPVEYACLAMLWGWFCLPVRARRGSLAFGGWVFLPGILFALSDEWHQSWVPGRFCSAWDVVLDAIGLCAGMAAVTALSHWAPLWHPARRHEPDQDWTKASVTARSP